MAGQSVPAGHSDLENSQNDDVHQNTKEHIHQLFPIPLSAASNKTAHIVASRKWDCFRLALT